MRNHIIRALIVVGLLSTMLFVQPTMIHAAGVVSTCNFASLSAALAGGGIVTFTCSGTITFTSAITMTGSTTIDATGQNVVLDGGGTTRLFAVNIGATLNLINLTLQNSGSAAIRNLGTLNITNSTLSGNSDPVDGGAIENNGNGRLTINNSTLSGNSGFAGGAIYNAVGTVIITNSTLSGNTAISGDGGAIYHSTSNVKWKRFGGQRQSHGQASA